MPGKGINTLIRICSIFVLIGSFSPASAFAATLKSGRDQPIATVSNTVLSAFPPAGSPTTPISLFDLESYPLAAYAETVVLTNTTQIVPIPADGSPLVATLVSNRPIAFTLSMPNGTLVTPAIAASDPAITYTEQIGTDLGSAGYMYQYQIQQPQVGTWQGRALANGIGYALLFAHVDSPIELVVLSNHSQSNPGDTITLQAALTDGDSVLSGSIFTGTVSLAERQIAQLTWYDNGTHGDPAANDGIVAAQYVAPSATGNLHFTVSARHGMTVRTSFDEVVALAPQTALFGGATSAAPSDTNGNGLYDTLNISTTLHVLQSGHFEVRGTLVDSNGQTVADTSYSTLMAETGPLAVGEHTIVLPFDGKTIRTSGKNGPYKLTNVSVHDITSLYLEEATANNVYTTAAYTARQFEGPLLSVLHGSEQVRDTDNDGLYDQLTINVQLDVLRPGVYGWNGALEDSEGHLLEWAAGSGTLDAQTPLQISFHGLPIGINGRPGPYTLTALSVYQITNIVNNYPATDGFYDVYHTAAYAASQFDQDASCSAGASLPQALAAAPRGRYVIFLPSVRCSAR